MEFVWGVGELLEKGWAEGDGFRRAAAAPPKNSTPLTKTYFFKGKRVFPRGNSVVLNKIFFPNDLYVGLRVFSTFSA